MAKPRYGPLRARCVLRPEPRGLAAPRDRSCGCPRLGLGEPGEAAGQRGKELAASGDAKGCALEGASLSVGRVLETAQTSFESDGQPVSKDRVVRSADNLSRFPR